MLKIIIRRFHLISNQNQNKTRVNTFMKPYHIYMITPINSIKSEKNSNQFNSGDFSYLVANGTEFRTTNMNNFRENILGHPDHFNKKSASYSTYTNRKSKEMNLLKMNKRNFCIKFNTNFEHQYISPEANFKELVLKNSIFSDKTSFINELIQTNYQIILITLPKGFGKSTNLDMIYRFFSIQLDENRRVVLDRKNGANYKLFYDRPNNSKEQLDIVKMKRNSNVVNKIEQSEEYCCTRPVIFIDFEICEGENYKIVKRKVQDKIKQLLINHDYLLNSKNIEIKKKFEKELKKISKSMKGIRLHKRIFNLCKLLHEEFGLKVWILIDNYENVLNRAFLEFDEKEVSKVMNLFKGIYYSIMNNNPYLEKCVITGIKFINIDYLFSSSISYKHYNLKKFPDNFFGIDIKEMDQILHHFKIKAEDSNTLRYWLGKYKVEQMKSFSEYVYSISSLVKWLNDTKIQFNYYCMDGLIFKFLDPFLLENEFFIIIYVPAIYMELDNYNINPTFYPHDLRKLKKITDQVKRDGKYSFTAYEFDLIFSYLFYEGYLTYSRGTNLVMPRGEIMEGFRYYLRNFHFRISNISIVKRIIYLIFREAV
jgi:hypothetical protein